MLDFVAVLDRLRLLELFDELLLPQKQILYDRTHESPSPEANFDAIWILDTGARELALVPQVRMFKRADGSCE